MAEIAVLSARHNAKGVDRLIASLAQAFEEGVDLGPRGRHVRALGLSIEHLLPVLRQEVEFLDKFRDVNAAAVGDAQHSLAVLISQIDKLCDSARRYPI